MIEALTGLLTSLAPYMQPILTLGAAALGLGLLMLILHYVLRTPVGPARWLGLIAAAVGVLFLAAHLIAKLGGSPAFLNLAQSANGQTFAVPYLQIGASLFFPGYLLNLFVGAIRRR